MESINSIKSMGRKVIFTQIKTTLVLFVMIIINFFLYLLVLVVHILRAIRSGGSVKKVLYNRVYLSIIFSILIYTFIPLLTYIWYDIIFLLFIEKHVFCC